MGCLRKQRLPLQATQSNRALVGKPGLAQTLGSTAVVGADHEPWKACSDIPVQARIAYIHSGSAGMPTKQAYAREKRWAEPTLWGTANISDVSHSLRTLGEANDTALTCC
jgi:hypothetical protein